ARAPQGGGRPGRLVDGHGARRRPEILPRADDAEAGRGDRGGQRQQVPVQDVQRLLDGRPRLFVEARHGDLRDIISRRHDEGAAVTVAPDDRLAIAYARMKLYDVSQLPVLEHDRVV